MSELTRDMLQQDTAIKQDYSPNVVHEIARESFDHHPRWLGWLGLILSAVLVAVLFYFNIEV